MKKNLKKFLISVLLLSFLINMKATGVKADDNNALNSSFEDTITKILSDMSQNKGKMGLTNIDFNDLSLGSNIPLYCLDGSIINNVVYIPIINNEKIVMFVIASCSNGIIDNRVVQIGEFYTNEINNFLNNNGDIAFIFDNQEILLYSSTTGNYEHLTNGDFVAKPMFLDNMQGIYPKLNKKLKISQIQLRWDNSKILSVPSLSQGNFNNLCWATCSASLLNYKRSTKLTAVDVAQTAVNNGYMTTLNTQLAQSQVAGLLRNVYNYPCTFYTNKITLTSIIESISNNNPIIVGTLLRSNPNFGHSILVCGYSLSNSLFYFMNPSTGSIYTGTNMVDEHTYLSYFNGSQEFILGSHIK